MLLERVYLKICDDGEVIWAMDSWITRVMLLCHPLWVGGPDMFGWIGLCVFSNPIEDEIYCERRVSVHERCLETSWESYLRLLAIHYWIAWPETGFNNLLVSQTARLSVKIAHKNHKIVTGLHLPIDPCDRSLYLMLPDQVIRNRMVKVCVVHMKSPSINE